MRMRGHLKKSYFMRRCLAWLVVVAIGLHSYIPVGYMPDFSSGGSAFALMACDGFEHDMPPGHEHMHHGAAHSHDTCPFATGAIASFAGINPPVITAPAYATQASGFYFVSAAPEKLPFGNASPRSPPFFS